MLIMITFKTVRHWKSFLCKHRKEKKQSKTCSLPSIFPALYFSPLPLNSLPPQSQVSVKTIPEGLGGAKGQEGPRMEL